MRYTYRETSESRQPVFSLVRRTMISKKKLLGQATDADTTLRIRQMNSVLVDNLKVVVVNECIREH